MAAAEGQQWLPQQDPHRQHQGQAPRQLDELPPPGGPGGKLEELGVKGVDHQDAGHGARHGVGVVPGLRPVLVGLQQRLGAAHRGLGQQLHIAHEGQAQGQHHADDGVHPVGKPQGALQQRVEGQHQHKADQQAHPHVRRGVDPQVHPGHRHQQGQDDTHHPHPQPPGEAGDAAQVPHGALGVAAGEAVARGRLPGGFHDGEVRVDHPGPGHPAGDLQPLAGQGAGKAHRQQVVAPALVPAPEDKEGGYHEKCLLPQPGHQGHDRVQDRGSDGFKPVEQRHRDLLIIASRFHSGTRSLSASRRPIISQRRRSSKPFLPPFSIALPYTVIFATILFAKSPCFVIVKQLTI